MRAAALPFVFAVLALSVFGCARAPRPGVPVERDRLERIAAAVSLGHGEGPLRITGSGELDLGGERHGFTFALVYDPPDWLRADVRPPLGSLSAGAGLSALLAGDTLTVVVPGGNAWFTGRLREIIPGIDRVDVVPFLLGRPDPGLLLRLSHPRAVREGREMIVAGDVYGREVSVAVDTTALAISAVDASLGGDTRLSVRYGVETPRTPAGQPTGASVLYTDGRARIGLALSFDAVRAIGPVERGLLAPVVPPTAAAKSWKDIGLGRHR